MPIKTIEILASDKVISKQSRFINDSGSELVLAVKRKFPFGSWICHQAIEIHLDSKTGFPLPNGYLRKTPRALSSEAELDYQNILSKLSSVGYKQVGSSILPEKICEANWDILSNLPRRLSNFCKNAFLDGETFQKTAQSNPASAWYSGNLPDPKGLTGYVGSSSVDASQLQGSFNGVHDAIQLVNKFDSSLLQNVAFIFNTSGGAYGVYVPWLDEQIKNAEIKNLLKTKGFEIDDSSNDFFTAYSKDKKVGEDAIRNEIANVQSQVHMQGGNTFGINMSKILSAASSDAKDSNLTDPKDIYDITVLHLGATMVHEAIHAKGSTSEGPSEQGEANFTQWALSIINENRFKRAESKGEEIAPLVSNPGSRRAWYNTEISRKIERKAQYGAQFSLANPTDGIAPWAGILWDQGGGAIEEMLYHRRQGPQKGSLEKRLRQQSLEFPNVNPSEITEMLLERDHDEFSSYKSIEDLLEERRPKPLAIMVDKIADSKKTIKTADESYNSTFGWMNNLDLPMSERIITEEQSDEFLNFDWKAIRKQPRYNPEYDRYGVYYRWNEPRMNSPELFDRMVAERPGSASPALRFAGTEDSEIREIVDVLFSTLELTMSGEIGGTRFLCGEKFISLIDKFFKDKKGISIYSFPVIGEYQGENIFPVWVTRESIPEKAVIVAEGYISGKTDEPKASDIFEHITGLSKQRKKIIDSVLFEATELAAKMGMDDLFIVGAFPRAFISEESWANVFDLDFVSSSPQECLKLGSLLAKKMGADGVEMARQTSTITWYYKGLKCDFKGKYIPQVTADLMKSSGIELSPVKLDVYSRSFTINMFAYKVSDGTVYDVSGQSARDMQKGVIRTYFNPEDVVKGTPIIILRAIKYACRYHFEIEKELKKAMLNNVSLLIRECDKSRLSLALREIIREGAKKAGEMITEYGLDGLYEIEETFKD